MATVCERERERDKENPIIARRRMLRLLGCFPYSKYVRKVNQQLRKFLRYLMILVLFYAIRNLS